MSYDPTHIQKQIESAVTGGRGYHDSPLYDPENLQYTLSRLKEKVYLDDFRPFKEDPLGIVRRNFALTSLLRQSIPEERR